MIERLVQESLTENMHSKGKVHVTYIGAKLVPLSGWSPWEPSVSEQTSCRMPCLFGGCVLCARIYICMWWPEVNWMSSSVDFPLLFKTVVSHWTWNLLICRKPVSMPQGWDHRHVSFMWVLGNWTQGLMVSWQALYHLSYRSAPDDNVFKWKF